MISGVKRSGMRVALVLGVMTSLAACEDGNFQFLNSKPDGDASSKASRSVKLIERDVEAPDVFQVTEAGLWDGRPSLGGVWVAHPDVIEPERVIIRNTTNDKFVIGALFRRERENPGPRLQVSSDAAAALGVLAGQPVPLNVTALRREQIEETPPEPEPKAEPKPEAKAIPAPADGKIEEKPLDPIKSAEKAIKKAEAKAKPAPAPKPTNPGLEKPYVQIGIFSVEANAKSAAKTMKSAGLKAQVKKQTSKGKTFWRVIVGPAKTAAERTSNLKKIKAKGFGDAYAVKG
jgi:cell division septation protein DedD